MFEGYKERSSNISKLLKEYKIKSLEDAKKICDQNNLDVFEIVKGVQNTCFDSACWAYTLGSAMAIKTGEKDSREIAKILGKALQSFCVPGSVAEKRLVGIGHGNLASMLLDEKSTCFAFLAGHESFAAAKGAMNIAKYANLVRKKPLKTILVGLGKDPAYIIARINGFTYAQTSYDYNKNTLKVVDKIKFGTNELSKVLVYGCDSVDEGVAIMKMEKVNISITGNSTNPVRFSHPVAGIYKKYCNEIDFNYYSVASGGGTGRTLHPDNVGAGPASYGLTDTMGRMHCNVQFAGSSSVPAHVAMMGFIGMGNNPIVGTTVALSVRLSKINNK